MSQSDEGMGNQRVAEFFFLALIIGIGTPVAVLWGANDGERMAAEAYPQQKAVAAPAPAQSKDMYLATPASIAEGKSLFQQNCTPCHGVNADGKGPAAVSLTPPPRNFTDPKAKWTRSRAPLDIFKTLAEGSPGTGMVSFAAALTVPQRWALVHYIGTLPGVTGQFTPIDEATAEKLAGGKP